MTPDGHLLADVLHLTSPPHLRLRPLLPHVRLWAPCPYFQAAVAPVGVIDGLGGVVDGLKKGARDGGELGGVAGEGGPSKVFAERTVEIAHALGGDDRPCGEYGARF